MKEQSLSLGQISDIFIEGKILRSINAFDPQSHLPMEALVPFPFPRRFRQFVLEHLRAKYPCDYFSFQKGSVFVVPRSWFTFYRPMPYDTPTLLEISRANELEYLTKLVDAVSIRYDPELKPILVHSARYSQDVTMKLLRGRWPRDRFAWCRSEYRYKFYLRR